MGLSWSNVSSKTLSTLEASEAAENKRESRQFVYAHTPAFVPFRYRYPKPSIYAPSYHTPYVAPNVYHYAPSQYYNQDYSSVVIPQQQQKYPLVAPAAVEEDLPLTEEDFQDKLTAWTLASAMVTNVLSRTKQSDYYDPASLLKAITSEQLTKSGKDIQYYHCLYKFIIC